MDRESKPFKTGLEAETFVLVIVSAMSITVYQTMSWKPPVSIVSIVNMPSGASKD